MANPSKRQPRQGPFVAEVTLKRPIMAFDEAITVLQYREPELGDFIGVNITDPFQSALLLTTRCCELPESSVRRIHRTDIAAVIDVTAGFLADSPATGSVSAESSSSGAESSPPKS